jgi:hypothetical protein
VGQEVYVDGVLRDAIICYPGGPHLGAYPGPLFNAVRHFSIEQVYPPKGVSALIASLLVEQSSGGTSLFELWDSIRDYASGDTELVMKVERICVDALGESWSESTKRRYDSELARESLRFYNVNGIPRVTQDQPAGVSEIHFRSSLAHAQPIQTTEYRNKGSLFEAFFGKA